MNQYKRFFFSLCFVLGYNTSTSHGDSDEILLDYILVWVMRALGLAENLQQSKYRHRVVAQIFSLVDDTSLTETLCDHDLKGEPVDVVVHSGGDNRSEYVKTLNTPELLGSVNRRWRWRSAIKGTPPHGCFAVSGRMDRSCQLCVSQNVCVNRCFI